MPTLLRALRLYSIVLWVGGIAFFAFVLAPVSFTYLPTPHEAGIVVRYSISDLHVIGFVCGIVFVIATLLLRRATRPLGKNHQIQAVLGVIMLFLTFASQVSVLPAMERDRLRTGGDVDAAPPSDPARLDFERLHVLSERLEAGILFLGLGVILLMAREDRYNRP